MYGKYAWQILTTGPTILCADRKQQTNVYHHWKFVQKNEKLPR